MTARMEPAAVQPPTTQRPISELSDSGLLWWINRVAFHPRGYALALVINDQGDATAWQLLGDGSEPWSFPTENESARFRATEATLASQPGRERASIKDIAAPLDFDAPLGFDVQIEPGVDGGSTIRFAVNHAIHDQGKQAVPAPRGIRSSGTAGSPEHLVAILLRTVQYAYAGTDAFQAPHQNSMDQDGPQ